MRPARVISLLVGLFFSSGLLAEWTDIMPGPSLEGWTAKPEVGHWSIVDGVLIAQNGDQKKGSNLWSNAEFGDFVFEGEFRYSGVVDSGVFVKTDAYQVNIGISSSLKADRTCSIYAPKDGAGKYPGLAEGVEELLKEGEWNQIRIEARGKTITVALNGKQVVEYETKALPEKGPVGLQVHAGLDMRIEFRKLRIRSL